jgi:hypothetical protein
MIDMGIQATCFMIHTHTQIYIYTHIYMAIFIFIYIWLLNCRYISSTSSLC